MMSASRQRRRHLRAITLLLGLTVATVSIAAWANSITPTVGVGGVIEEESVATRSLQMLTTHPPPSTICPPSSTTPSRVTLPPMSSSAPPATTRPPSATTRPPSSRTPPTTTRPASPTSPPPSTRSPSSSTPPTITRPPLSTPPVVTIPPTSSTTPPIATSPPATPETTAPPPPPTPLDTTAPPTSTSPPAVTTAPPTTTSSPTATEAPPSSTSPPATTSPPSSTTPPAETPTPPSTTAPPPTTGQPSNTLHAQLLAAVNEQRAASGLSSVCTNLQLQSAAQRHSNDMATNNFVGHTGSDGSTMPQRATEAGFVWSAMAENVAAGPSTAELVVASWMASDELRANVLNTDITMAGAGYAYNADNADKHYWTLVVGAGDTKSCVR